MPRPLIGGGAVAPPEPKAGTVELWPDNGGRPVTLILLDAPDRAGSVGGWQTSERVLRPDGSWWKSRPLGTLSLPCVLDIDALPREDPIERTLKRLYAMGHHHRDADPPGIRLYGDVPQSRGRWRLDDITLGDRIYRAGRPGTEARQHRLRQQKLTLALTELRPVKTIADVDIRRTRAHGKRRRREIRTTQGDTLRSVAVRELGTQAQWRDIREWNPRLAKRHVDPDERLRPGTLLVLR